MVKRDRYLERLISFRDKKIVKVITGIRRCGKSTLLEIFQQYLFTQGVQNDQVISINFEDMDFDYLRDVKTLYSYIKANLNAEKMNYIFLDEIQQVENFQRVVDSLYIKKNIDIYITGSNAGMLSGEIATLLSGRYVEIEMLPLSFREYVDYSGDHNELNKKYSDYLEFSSFPYVLDLGKDKKIIQEYLNGIFNTIVLKDVISRNRISDVMMLESIIRFLFHNIGNISSTKKISDTMTSQGRKVSTHTVESYIKSLMNSYIIYQARRYDIKGKQYLKTMEKYYVVDIGLRYTVLGNAALNTGHILENIVYLELVRRGYNVYIGKVDNLEVDFIAINNNGVRYYQVAATVREKSTLERELQPFKKIKDDYPKILLTLDDDPESDYNGITKKNALEFLLEDE